MLALIAAIAQNGVIGRDGGLPWRLPEDLAHFKRTTLGHVVVMGRRTWQSIGRPLPGRENRVVSRTRDFEAPGARVFSSVDEALERVPPECDVFVIGGESLYAETLARADRLVLTFVEAEVAGDVYFPEFDRSAWREVSAESFPADARHAHPFRIVTLERRILRRDMNDSEKTALKQALKHEVCASVDALSAELLRISHEIHAHPELAFEETRAAKLLTDAVADAGLPVERGAYGLETAFASEVGRAGPRVALLAEYDALPEIGHACGHNLIATAAVGAAFALGRLGDRLPGRMRLLGTPAEERGGGKELMAREGALDGVDAALMVHPAGIDLATMPCLCIAELDVTYHGEAAHASAMAHRGINALDALVIGYQAVAALRQHIQSNERIHGIITNGGLAPNIVPERAAGRFYVRAGTEQELAALKRRVLACFEAGAQATGARLEAVYGEVDYLDLNTSWPLADAYQRNAESLGRTFFPFDKLPASAAGSTDMGNVSQRVPSIHPMIAAAPPHVTIHNAEFASWAGSELGDKAALDGAKALAMTALDFWLDPDLQKRTAEAFESYAQGRS